jgi:NAD-dependent deacetylase
MSADALFALAAELICTARHVIALTGAGISTPSGIPDFRSAHSGLWSKVNPFLVASLQVFRIRPQLFFDWVRPLVQVLLDAVPNPAHLALAQLEQMGRLKAIITQNIDNLHQKAGSRNVIEVHGHMRQATCIRCYNQVPTDTLLPHFLESSELPRCARCGSVLKPNVILFGEQLPVKEMNAARQAASACDLMLIAGSSLDVLPAADLPYIARDHGAQVIVINQQPTRIDELASVVIREDVAVALPNILAHMACVDPPPYSNH